MLVSIIIRTFNEERHIGRLLTDVFKQETTFPFEVIVVDSGSTDATLDIAGHFDTRVVNISPDQFSFGRSLNMGIAAAQGKYCAIISAHCFPVDNFWLANLIQPMQEDENIAAVFGKQHGDHTTRFSEHQIFAKWFPDDSTHDYPLPFFNNANSAIRRSFWEKRPFDEFLTGLEDLDWAKHIKASQKKIAYNAKAEVFHLHNETWNQIYRRYFREAYAYKAIYPRETVSFLDFLKFLTLNVIGDSLFALRQHVFMRQLFGIIAFRFLQFYATYRAHRSTVSIPPDMQRKLYYPKRPRFLEFANRPKPLQVQYELFDISAPLHPELPVWPGSQPLSIAPFKTFEKDGVRDSNLSMNLHTGTHMDAPSHMLNSGTAIEKIDLHACLGDCTVVEHFERSPISRAFLEKQNLPTGTRRILFKTINSYAKNGGFNSDFVALSPDAAAWIAEKQFVLVGIDGPSIQSFNDSSPATHEILLKNIIVILEGLCMESVRGGKYKLIALPLKLLNAEGAPVRCVLYRGNL